MSLKKQKLDANVVDLTTHFGRFTGKRLSYGDEREQVAFRVVMAGQTDLLAEHEAMIERIFRSFHQWPRNNRERDAVYQ